MWIKDNRLKLKFEAFFKLPILFFYAFKEQVTFWIFSIIYYKCIDRKVFNAFKFFFNVLQKVMH